MDEDTGQLEQPHLTSPDLGFRVEVCSYKMVPKWFDLLVLKAVQNGQYRGLRGFYCRFRALGLGI